MVKKKKRENIEKSHLYVGLTTNDMEDYYIKEAVLDILKPATTIRIRHAKKYTCSVVAAQELNGKPVIKVTLFCKADDQYCDNCGGYGCPGTC